MDAKEIAERWTSGEQTPAREAKAKALAARAKVSWSDVLDAAKQLSEKPQS